MLAISKILRKFMDLSFGEDIQPVKQPVQGAYDEVHAMPVVFLCMVCFIWNSKMELGKVTDNEFSDVVDAF